MMMRVHLPPDLQRDVQAVLASGAFRDTDDLIAQALRTLLMDHETFLEMQARAKRAEESPENLVDGEEGFERLRTKHGLDA
ncbi:MAG: type II toxin-antitoxin system ParD family antitoxin [Alphaproteobacteria bacterium]